MTIDFLFTSFWLYVAKVGTREVNPLINHIGTIIPYLFNLFILRYNFRRYRAWSFYLWIIPLSFYFYQDLVHIGILIYRFIEPLPALLLLK